MDKNTYLIGVEIEKHSVDASLFDGKFETIASLKFTVENAKNTGAKCLDIIDGLIKKAGISPGDVKGIGIGVSKKSANLARKIKKQFKIDAVFAPPAVCAAAGELHSGCASNLPENILYIYSDLGTGVVLDRTGVKNPSPNESGYLKPWDSSFGIAQIAKREVARGVGTKIVAIAGGRVENINDEVVSQAARQGDEVAKNIIHSVGVTLGMRIAYLVNLFAPKAVILGAGFIKAGQLLADPITDIVGKLALVSKAQSLKIIIGKLNGEAVSFGATALTGRQIFTNYKK